MDLEVSPIHLEPFPIDPKSPPIRHEPFPPHRGRFPMNHRQLHEPGR
jgi:hypothetical protein